MINGHAPISHKVKHQDELRGITAKLMKIEKLEVRGGPGFVRSRVQEARDRGGRPRAPSVQDCERRTWM